MKLFFLKKISIWFLDNCKVYLVTFGFKISLACFSILLLCSSSGLDTELDDVKRALLSESWNCKQYYNREATGIRKRYTFNSDKSMLISNGHVRTAKWNLFRPNSHSFIVLTIQFDDVQIEYDLVKSGERISLYEKTSTHSSGIRISVLSPESYK